MGDILKVHFDTEFDGLRKDTDLISIGLVCEFPGKCKVFYAEVKDFGSDNDWINEHVIGNLFKGNMDKLLELGKFFKDQHVCNITDVVYVEEDIETISEQFIAWVEEIHSAYPDRKIQFVSDCSSYDWVLLVDILTNFQTALDLPDYVIPYCHDINQDIAIQLHDNDGVAFDENREMYANVFAPDELDNLKHNALWDAVIIKKIDETQLYV